MWRRQPLHLLLSRRHAFCRPWHVLAKTDAVEWPGFGLLKRQHLLLRHLQHPADDGATLSLLTEHDRSTIFAASAPETGLPHPTPSSADLTHARYLSHGLECGSVSALSFLPACSSGSYLYTPPPSFRNRTLCSERHSNSFTSSLSKCQSTTTATRSPSKRVSSVQLKAVYPSEHASSVKTGRSWGRIGTRGTPSSLARETYSFLTRCRIQNGSVIHHVRLRLRQPRHDCA